MEKESFLKVERMQKKEIIGKEQIVSDKVPFLRGMERVYGIDYLTSTDQVIPC